MRLVLSHQSWRSIEVFKQDTPGTQMIRYSRSWAEWISQVKGKECRFWFVIRGISIWSCMLKEQMTLSNRDFSMTHRTPILCLMWINLSMNLQVKASALFYTLWKFLMRKKFKRFKRSWLRFMRWRWEISRWRKTTTPSLRATWPCLVQQQLKTSCRTRFLR